MTETTTWLDLGPAEFDAKRLPKGYQKPSEDQSALFFAAIPPAPAKARDAGELDGQEALFSGP